MSCIKRSIITPRAIGSIIHSLLVVLLAISLVACTSDLLGDSSQASGESGRQQVAGLYGEIREAQNAGPGTAQYGDLYIPLNPLIDFNAYSVDFNDIVDILAEINGTDDLYLMNVMYRGLLAQQYRTGAGIAIQFYPSGQIVDVLIQATSANPRLDKRQSYSDRFLYDQYLVTGTTKKDDSFGDAMIDILGGRAGGLAGLYVSTRYGQIAEMVADSPVDFIDPAFLSFREFADSYNKLGIRNVISDYAVGDPVLFQLTSEAVNISELLRPGVNVTFLECMDYSYHRMDIQQVEKIIENSQQGYYLEIEGYWYLTIVPYYQADGLEGSSEAGVFAYDFQSSESRSVYSADNIIVLCFAVTS